MNPHGNSGVGRRRKPAYSYAFTAVLVLAAMLVGLLAMHSMAGGHHTESGAAETAHVDVVPSAANVGAVTAVSVVTAAVVPLVQAEVGLLSCADCMLECAVWAMTCAIVLILAALILLARSPSTYKRLLDAGGRVLSVFRGPPLHLFRPSLVVLSISRT